MATSKTKIANANKKGKYVLVDARGKYIEEIVKNGSIIMLITTGNIGLAFRTNKPEEITKKYGIQNFTIETFAENNK